MYEEVKQIFYSFTFLHFLSFFYLFIFDYLRFKSMTFNIDYINNNFVLLNVKEIQLSNDRALIRVIDIY